MDTKRIAASPVFANLPAHELNECAGVMREVEVEAGATVIRAGDYGTALYLIEAGMADVLNDAGGEIKVPHDVAMRRSSRRRRALLQARRRNRAHIGSSALVCRLNLRPPYARCGDRIVIGETTADWLPTDAAAPPEGFLGRFGTRVLFRHGADGTAAACVGRRFVRCVLLVCRGGWVRWVPAGREHREYHGCVGCRSRRARFESY
jgi:hypothetical protein